MRGSRSAGVALHGSPAGRVPGIRCFMFLWQRTGERPTAPPLRVKARAALGHRSR